MKKWIHSSTHEDFVINTDLSYLDRDDNFKRAERRRVSRELEDKADYYDAVNDEGEYEDITSSYQPLDVKVVKSLADFLKKNLPDEVLVKTSPRSDVITLYTEEGADLSMIQIGEYLEDFALDQYYSLMEVGQYGPDHNFVLIKGEAFVGISVYYSDYENTIDLFFDFDTGNILFEDWYDEYVEQFE